MYCEYNLLNKSLSTLLFLNKIFFSLKYEEALYDSSLQQ